MWKYIVKLKEGERNPTVGYADSTPSEGRLLYHSKRSQPSKVSQVQGSPETTPRGMAQLAFCKIFALQKQEKAHDNY